MVIEDDFSKLKLLKSVAVHEIKHDRPTRAVDLEMVDRVPSCESEVEINMSDLLPLIGQWVMNTDAHFGWIATWMIVR